MAAFTDYQRSLCLEAIDKVLKYSISKMFAAPVDPEKDSCPVYLEKIKNPMDLGTARKKLIDNEYQTLDDFKNDVALIWENTILYHGKNAIISYLAQQLNEVFKMEMKCVLPDDNQSWLAKYDELKQQAGEYKLIVDPNSVKTVTRVHSTTHQPKTTTNTRSRSKAEDSIQLTDDEIQSIVDDADKIKDNGTSEQVQSLIDYIARQEPKYVEEDGSVNVEISKLKNTTLIGLRKTLDTILEDLKKK